MGSKPMRRRILSSAAPSSSTARLRAISRYSSPRSRFFIGPPRRARCARCLRMSPSRAGKALPATSGAHFAMLVARLHAGRGGQIGYRIDAVGIQARIAKHMLDGIGNGAVAVVGGMQVVKLAVAHPGIGQDTLGGVAADRVSHARIAGERGGYIHTGEARLRGVG